MIPVTQAGEIGHYNGGVYGIRDFFVPQEPGFYGLVYNYYYSTDRLNNRDGDKVRSVSVGPANVNVNVDLHMYALIPVFAWVSPCKVLGANYAAYVAPSFADNSVSAHLSIANVAGGSINHSADFGMGDLYVQPVWLDWAMPHWDFMLAYGFYAPVGRYDTHTVALPGGADVTLEYRNNLGLGFWTQQSQAGIAW